MRAAAHFDGGGGGGSGGGSSKARSGVACRIKTPPSQPLRNPQTRGGPSKADLAARRQPHARPQDGGAGGGSLGKIAAFSGNGFGARSSKNHDAAAAAGGGSDAPPLDVRPDGGGGGRLTAAQLAAHDRASTLGAIDEAGCPGLRSLGRVGIIAEGSGDVANGPPPPRAAGGGGDDGNSTRHLPPPRRNVRRSAPPAVPESVPLWAPPTGET